MLSVLFPVIPFDILWDLQYVQSIYASHSLSSHSVWYIVRFTVRSVKPCFPFSFQSFCLIYCEIYSTFSKAVLPVLLPVILFDILWDLQYVQSSCASHSPSSHSVWYIVRFTVRSVKPCFPFSFQSFCLIYCEIYSMFSQAVLLLLFTDSSISCVFRFTVPSAEPCFASSRHSVAMLNRWPMQWWSSTCHHRNASPRTCSHIMFTLPERWLDGSEEFVRLLGDTQIFLLQCIYKQVLKVCSSVILSLYKSWTALCFPILWN